MGFSCAAGFSCSGASSSQSYERFSFLKIKNSFDASFSNRSNSVDDSGVDFFSVLIAQPLVVQVESQGVFVLAQAFQLSDYIDWRLLDLAE